MTDPTKNIRRGLTAAINTHAKTRGQLEAAYGPDNVWNTDELGRDFEVLGFLAPMCVVKRLSDGKRGSVVFQHEPRFYYDFNEG